jgi:precorrin-3B synthase
MRSGDGLIVRLRIGGGIVDTSLAERIAAWSLRWGNGQIDLSGRGNLQLRGIADRHLDALRDAIAEAGLLDPSAGGEAVRNVISSPLAGLDPSAVLDVRPLAHALERRLSLDATLHGLPGKFGFVIDDGGALGLDDLTTDIRFKARSGSQGPEFTIGLAGAAHALSGACRPERLVDVAVALSRAFLDARHGREASIRRMRDLAAAVGAEAIGRAARLGRDSMSGCPSPCASGGLNTGPPQPYPGIPLPDTSAPLPDTSAPLPDTSAPRPDTSAPLPDTSAPLPDTSAPRPDTSARLPDTSARLPDRRTSGPSVVILGLDPRISLPTDLPTTLFDAAATTAPLSPANEPTNIAFLGLGLPFGRVAATDLSRLAFAAAAAGARELRLTPWRMILVPLPSAGAAHALSAALSGTAFILDAGDPRRRVAACPGAPSCARGSTPVRDHATALAEVLGSSLRTTSQGAGIVLHVSGCEKGCAHPRAAQLTLVAQNGRYQLVRDGRPSDTPIARNLTLDQAADWLMAHLAEGAA